MRFLPRLASLWALVFAAVHAYWAAGGATGMNGDPADTPATQGYIAFITLLGLGGAAVAHGLAQSRRRALVLLARAGGLALLAGVAVGSARWIADGSLGDDGTGGVVLTAYFLLGGLLFLAATARPRR